MNAAGSWGDTNDAYIGNYGDNSLLYFDQYRNAQPGTALYENAVTGTNAAVSGTIFDKFRSDCRAGALPQVSWLVAPEAYSEHPNWPANYGAYYVSQILDALTSNPAVWSKTVFLVVYDENDGFFDHVVPPTPPQSAAQGLSNVSIANEIFPGSIEYPSGPYGLGARVPMLVVSPWSKGGWVNSEIFDHTSMIRFIAARFGTKTAPLSDPNITAWRTAVCGDLTSAFNFATPNSAAVALPNTSSYVPPDDERHDSYYPLPPALQALPAQEPGMRPARAVPYVLNATAAVNISQGQVALNLINSGSRTGALQVRSAALSQPPRSYTLAGRTSLSDTWDFSALGLLPYSLSIYGPNGFFRAYAGGMIPSTSAEIQTTLAYQIAEGGVFLTAVNVGRTDCNLQILDVYTSARKSAYLKPGARVEAFYSLGKFHGWYDLVLTVAEDQSFRQQLAGHLESGKDSMSDPAIGKTG